MKNLLITGASGRLGKALVDIIRADREDIKNLVVTSRHPDKLNYSESFITPVSLDLYQDFYTSNFYSQLKDFEAFDTIVHCAAPYPTESLMEVTSQQLADCMQLIAHEMCLLTEFVRRLKNGGSLIICGSVSGMRSDVDLSDHSQLGKIGNFGGCSLHAMHKGMLYDFTNCLYQANGDKAIVYANLGPFMSQVAPDKTDEILTTAAVAEKVYQLLYLARLQQLTVNIFPKATTPILSLLKGIN